MPSSKQVNLIIDELTASLRDPRSGENLATDYKHATAREVANLKGWLFNWRNELNTGDVYKLFLKKPRAKIEGLVSLRDSGDHIWVNLAEAAPHNLGSAKRYIGVGGNLFAIAVKISFAKGYNGFVAFEAKTELLNHYQTILGAIRVGRSTRMIIDSSAARRLQEKYFA